MIKMMVMKIIVKMCQLMLHDDFYGDVDDDVDGSVEDEYAENMFHL